VRDRINEQVAHLSRCREAKIDWDLRSLVLACCTQFLRFVDAVDKDRHERSPAFNSARTAAQRGLDDLAE
jgi:hypothetical protein